MFYEIEYTQPSLKIKKVEDYKRRAKEIVYWQIKETLAMKLIAFQSLFSSRSIGDFFYSLLIIAFTIISIPFAVAYITLCLFELFLDTLLLPLFLVPYIRFIPCLIVGIVWSTSFAIGIFGGVALRKNRDEVVDDYIALISNNRIQYQNKIESKVDEIKSINVSDEIREYKKLLDEGAISEEEYDAIKKKLLQI